ncbi:MAG TPA: ComF family protein [bacterium]|nr:ComF family protein [bacterium]
MKKATISPMKLYYEALLRLIYPATCGACTRLLELDEKGLCSKCRLALCSLRFSPADCAIEESIKGIDEGWTLYPYEFPVKEIISGIKFSRKRWLVRTFEDEVADFFTTLSAERIYDFLIPIPLDPRKRLDREFNQSELIAMLIEKKSGIPVKRRILTKQRNTPPQSQLPRHERQTNLNNAFQVRHRDQIRGKRLLLVDDILTTGATSGETARLLKKSGAKRVDVFTLARTKPSRGGSSH